MVHRQKFRIWKLKWYIYYLLILSFALACNSFQKKLDLQEDVVNKSQKYDTMNDRNEPFDLNGDVIIPNYQPLKIPYSEWELHRNTELLEVNGFAANEEAWRTATSHSSGLIRGAAYFALMQDLKVQDEPLFLKGLSDLDETVQTYSAYGLHQLGNETALEKLLNIARLSVDNHVAAMQAAGLCGQLGMAESFLTIEQAMSSEFEYVQVFGIQNAMFFEPLHKSTFGANLTLDIWSLYKKALLSKSGTVKAIAMAQLKEFDSSEARELLGI